MSAPSPSSTVGKVTTRSRSQSQEAPSHPGSRSSSPDSAHGRRTLAGSTARNQRGAGADANAITSATPFDELSPAQQFVALDNDEMVETVLDCWWPGEAYLSLVDEFSLEELKKICTRLKCMASGSAKSLRTTVITRIERWAKDNPLLVPLDSDGDPPRTRSAGIKAAKAAAAAQRRASKVQYSEDDDGASTDRQSDRSDSEEDPDYSPKEDRRGGSRSRPLAPAVSRRGTRKPTPSQACVDALGSMALVSAAAPHRSRDSVRTGRRISAAPAPPAATSGRSRRSRRRASSSSSDSSSSVGSDFDEDAFVPEEEEEDRPLSHRDSDRKSSSRGKGGHGSFATEWIANVLVEADSVSERYATVTAKWNSERNRKEAMVLAKIIDLILSGQSRQALDKAVRRIAGVHTAESSGSWALSNVLENNTEAQSFLPARTWSAAAKMAARLESMRKSAPGAGGSSSSAGKDKAKGGGGSSSSSGSYGQSRDRSSGAPDAKSTGSHK